jgi:hypothetical protein
MKMKLGKEVSMLRTKRSGGALLALLLTFVTVAAPVRAYAQNPTGNVEGIVTDAQGGALRGATVVVTQKETGFERSVTTDDSGTYRVSQLKPGNYNITVTAQGFKKAIVDSVTVAVGQSLPLDVQLTAGGVDETVEIQSGEATVDRSDNTIDGVVNTIQIASLPLNGRNFLDLARLQPGAETIEGGGFDPTKANYTGVSLGGQAGRSTQITVDGGSVVDNVVGTTVQNFSQEIISEFQVGISNGDVGGGASSSGSINVITKSGTNDYHGNGYIYYRDDQFAAFPALKRLVDADATDPIQEFQARRVQFDRQQFGGSIGGPIVKDKAFFFGNVEYNNQDSVNLYVVNDPLIPGFTGFSGGPYNQLLITGRVDWLLNEKHTIFGRYSHDDNDNTTPQPLGSGIVPRESASGIFASNNIFQTNDSDGITAGITSVLKSNLVNDFRYSFNDFTNELLADPNTDPNAPELRVRLTTFRSGKSRIAPQATTQRRHQVRDDVTWTLGQHTARFGGNWEHTGIGGLLDFLNPGIIQIHDTTVTGPLITEADFLNAPVRFLQIGVGNPILPFDHPGEPTVNDRLQFYANDTWKIHPRFTLNYGVQYRYDSNLFNHELLRPEIVAPLFGRGRQPSENDLNNIAPRVGFAWDVAGDAKTVVRGGVGIYYDTLIDNVRLFETADLVPAGNNVILGPTQIISNLLPGGDGFFPTPDPNFTLADALAVLPALRAEVTQRAFENNAPTSIEALGVVNQLSSSELEVPYSIQYSVGVQRELPWNIVLQADFNYRKSLHEIIAYDANKADSVDLFGNPTPLLGDAFPVPVPIVDTSGFSVYKALLMRADKRFTNGLQFTASYALSSLNSFGLDSLGLGGALTDLNNFRNDFGPAGLDRRHRLVISGLYDFPRYSGDSGLMKGLADGWQVSAISQHFSGLPLTVNLPDSLDLTGTGTFASYLPGTGPGSLGRSVTSISELNNLISAYNANRNNFAAVVDGGVPFDAHGTELRALALLPENLQAGGDSVHSTDLRVTKKFFFTENTRLDLIAEVFNLFNVANLVYTPGQDTVWTLVAQDDVDAFEQNNPGGFKFPFDALRPTSRQNSIFGAGGPRAFQFAVKFTF